MKKIILTVFTVVSLVVTSCNNSTNEESKDESKKEMTLCDCATINLEQMKEIKAAEDDDAAIQKIKVKYSKDEETCRTIGKEFQGKLEILTEEESQAEFDKLKNECPAFKEIMGGN